MTTRVACAQIPLSIGDTAGNRTSCRTAIEAAARDGPAIAEWANPAEAFGLTIVAGFPEAAGDAIYNSAAVVDPTGLRGVYRKAHLWDSENAVFDRGDDLPMVVDTDHGRVGVMVCYGHWRVRA